MKILLSIVTPEREVFAESVDEVVLPSENGSMGVRPGHAPLLARMQVGEVSYDVGNKRYHLAISGGYAEVLRDSVKILADTAERAEEIDVQRAEQARDRAKKRIEVGEVDTNLVQAEASLRRALNRIATSGRTRV